MFIYALKDMFRYSIYER